MKTPTQRATRRLAVSLAIITALAAAQSAWAGYWDWVGKGAGETSYFDDYGTPASKETHGCWFLSLNNGESANFSNFNHNFSNAGGTRPTYNPDWDKVVTFRALTTLNLVLKVEYDATPITFVAEGTSYGINSASYLLIQNNAELAINSGTYSFTYAQIGNASGKTGKLTIENATVKTTGNFTRIGADGGNGILTVKSGASFDNIGQTTNPNMTLGQDSGSSGTLNVEGGSLTITGYVILNYNSGANSSTVNVTDGGVLTVGRMYLNNKGTSGGTITLDGGTLKAYADDTPSALFLPAHDNLTVTVGAGGGTIDTNGKNITVENAITGSGCLYITGGGTVTFTAAPSVKILVVPGTTISASASIADTILSNGLELAGVPALGTPYTVLTSTEDLSGLSLGNVTCGVASASTPTFGDGNTSIVVTVTAYKPGYWTGAVNDGDLSNPANWSDNIVPTTGNADIFCTTNSTLTKGATFAPTSITFLGGSAAVTVNGEFSGITAITNNSPSKVEFKDAVAFSGNVDVVQNTGAVKFTGGATGTQLARATDIHGTYNLTTTAELTEKADTTVRSDGVYNLLDGTFYKHNADFHVEAGGKTMVKNAKIQKNSSGAKLLGTFNGEFIVTNEFLVSGNGANSYVTHNMCNSGSGTFIVNKLRMTSRGAIVPAGTTIIGAGGIRREGTGYVRVLDNGSREIGSCADWTMYCDEIGSKTNTSNFVFYKHSSSTTWSHLTFDTTDYYDNTIGRTITCEAPIGADGSDSAEKFRVTVKGKGKFVFANTSDTTIFSGGLTVQDTATVEVKPNAKPGKGAITLGAGTTLALTSTGGSFTPLTNALTLPTGENKKATIRIDGARLRSGEGLEIATIGNAASVTKDNVKIEGDAIGGRKTTLRIEGGKLLLNIQPEGLMVIFR